VSNYSKEVADQACVVRLPKGFPFDDFIELAGCGNWRIVDATEQSKLVRFARDFPLKDLFDFAESRNWKIVWRHPNRTGHDNPRLYDAVPAEQYKMAKELFEAKQMAKALIEATREGAAQPPAEQDETKT
jgi:hypothetical protein